MNIGGLLRLLEVKVGDKDEGDEVEGDVDPQADVAGEDEVPDGDHEPKDGDGDCTK